MRTIADLYMIYFSSWFVIFKLKKLWINVHLWTYSIFISISFWNCLYPFPIEYFTIISFCGAENCILKTICTSITQAKKDKTRVLLLQRYTVPKGICQETVNVLCWTEILHFCITVLASKHQDRMGRRLKLALELNQASLSPKQLIYAALRKDL